jgi:hypothetical protein
MKNVLFLTITALFLFVACGKDEESGKSNSRFSTDPYKVSTVEGYVSRQQPIFEVSNQTYTLSQASYQIMTQAFQLADQQGIQPQVINGQQKYRARITGSLGTMNYPMQQNSYQYPNQQYNQMGANTLNVQSAVIIR